MYRKFTFFLLVFLFIQSAVIGQITITNTQSPSNLVDNVLLGNGITASNITVNGSAANANNVTNKIGYFEKGNSTFPINRGVVMSTGNVNNLPGPANNFASTAVGGGSDPDLVTISGVNINDANVLEFDFVATGDSMQFKYLFGSEEYPEFVGAGVNDAFGFFLSGPGINGPFSNNSVNLAIIPNTTTYVSINTVNQNVNTTYYVSNAANVYGTSTLLDGMTVVLAAVSGLTCGATYHIKLAIGDGGDSVYDSAVFLEAESFKSNVVKIEAESNLVGNFTDSIMAEGCTSTNLIFSRPEIYQDSVQDFFLTFGGTADPNTDFVNLVDTVHFPAGVDTVIFLVTPVADGITEPMEYLDIYGYSITICGDTVYDSLRLYIVDFFQLTWDLPDSATAVCVPDTPMVQITNLDNSIGPYTYLWSFGDTTNPAYLPNNGFQPDTIVHYVEITDGCNVTFYDSVVLVVDSIVPTINMAPGYFYEAECINDIPTATASVGNPSLPPYGFSWSTGTNNATTNLPNNGINMDTIWYYVTLTDGCGNSIVDSVRLTTDYEVPEFTITPNDTLYAKCPTDLKTVSLNQNFGTYGPYIHDWSNGDSGIPVQIGNNGVINDQQWHYVITTNACGMSTIDSVLIINDFTPVTAEILPNDTLIVKCFPDSALAWVTVTNNSEGPFIYAWSNGSSNDSTMITTPGPNGSLQNFTVTVTDNCGYQTTKNGVILVLKTLNIDTLESYPTLQCAQVGQVAAQISGQTNPVQYNWTGPGSGNPNSINASVWSNLEQGWYYFTAIDAECSVSDSVYVELLDSVVAGATANPPLGNNPLPVTFSNSTDNGFSYFWDFGDGNTLNTNSSAPVNHTYLDSGTYTVMLISYQGPCSDTTYLTVVVTTPPPPPPFQFTVPNVFTPNGDGSNDFYTFSATGVANISVQIFNRWGNLCWEGFGPNPSWDGTMKSGNDAEDGVYYYKYSLQSISGESYSGHGFLHLMRE